MYKKLYFANRGFILNALPKYFSSLVLSFHNGITPIDTCVSNVLYIYHPNKQCGRQLCLVFNFL